MFTLIVKFAFPNEIVYHKEFFFENEEELNDFIERVNNCPYTEAVKQGFIDKDEYLPL